MQKRFLLRISPDLWDELSRWAADDLRSVNGQIEFLLREAVRTSAAAKRRRRRSQPKATAMTVREARGIRRSSGEAGSAHFHSIANTLNSTGRVTGSRP